MESINTCLLSIADSRILAYYAHLIPIIFSVFISFFVFIKAKKTFLSKIFLAFTLTMSLWLIGDLIVWASNNYNLVYALWAPLDLIEIVFYATGLYFVSVYVKESDLSLFQKVLLFGTIIPALVVTLMGNSVQGFEHYWCEAINNNFLTSYKLIIEIFFLLMILSLMLTAFKIHDKIKRKQMLVLGGSIFGMLAVFGVAEHLASVTAYYELHLYSMFTMPLFILVIIYSIFDLDIFKFKILKTHFLVVGFLILMVSQLFFIQDSTEKFLTLFTVVLAFGFSFLLFKNFRKESDQREKIEKLAFQLSDANEKLKGVDKLKTEFLSLASHQLRSPLTAIKGYASMLIDGSYGDIAEKNKQPIERIFESSNNLALIVEDLLSVTKIEQGGMQYEFSSVDLVKMAKSLTEELSISAKNKGIELTFEGGLDIAIVKADPTKLRQVVLNFIDNSIKYTPKGTVKVSVEETPDKKVRFIVRDTGIGMSKETRQKLFGKFNRGEEGERVNSGGSGLGLYLAKEIVDAHSGVVLAESDGPGKGSTFIMELPLKNGNKKEEAK